MHDDAYVRDIATLRITDAEEAGGKGANLGELVAAGLPAPPGFVLMRSSYQDSMRAGGIDTELAVLHAEALADAADTARLSELCRHMQSLVTKVGVCHPVRDATLAAYRRLGADSVVAVRSSATGEDGRDASFAGMNRTVTNVVGEAALEAVTQCWSSLFTPRVLTYRASRGFTAPPAMAVVVQQMIAAEQAGVAFTSDPSTGNGDHVVIEAAFGQGEVVVSGKVQPDTYVVDKQTLQVLDARIGFKAIKIVRDPEGHDAMIELAPPEAQSRVLDDELYAESRSWRSRQKSTTAVRRMSSGPSLPARCGWCRPGPSRRWPRPARTKNPACLPAGFRPHRVAPPAACGSYVHPRTGSACSTVRFSWRRRRIRTGCQPFAAPRRW